MKILHIAPINVAGVPYAMMDMQRRFGHSSRLVTLHANTLTFPEDICLQLPLPRSFAARAWRSYKTAISNVPPSQPPVLRPRNMAERMYFSLDDWRRKAPVMRAIEAYDLDSFDVIHYDGGLDLFRDNRTAHRWKKMGKKIVCHYMGSDLRTRGINEDLDLLSDLNLTNESDHLNLHKAIHYIFIPFDASLYTARTEENRRLRVIHSPTNRAMKGTHLILAAVNEVRKQRDIEFILAERMPHAELMKLKMTCDIAIEQVGNFGGTGYGRNSLETLAMGIPTITEMAPDYIAWIPENPFMLATPESLTDCLLELIDDRELRKRKAAAGRIWVERYHSYESVHNRLMSLYKDHGIL